MVDGNRTPWHLWLVGVLSLLWSAVGGADFTLSVTRGDAHYRAMGMSEAMIAYMHAMPAWMMIVWAAGVWGAVIGSVLLLLRTRWAVHAFAVSLLGAAVSLVYQYFLSDGIAVSGATAFMPAVIVAIAALLLWYAWSMARRGVLR